MWLRYLEAELAGHLTPAVARLVQAIVAAAEGGTGSEIEIIDKKKFNADLQRLEGREIAPDALRQRVSTLNKVLRQIYNQDDGVRVTVELRKKQIILQYLRSDQVPVDTEPPLAEILAAQQAIIADFGSVIGDHQAERIAYVALKAAAGLRREEG